MLASGPDGILLSQFTTTLNKHYHSLQPPWRIPLSTCTYIREFQLANTARSSLREQLYLLSVSDKYRTGAAMCRRVHKLFPKTPSRSLAREFLVITLRRAVFLNLQLTIGQP